MQNFCKAHLLCTNFWYLFIDISNVTGITRDHFYLVSMRKSQGNAMCATSHLRREIASAWHHLIRLLVCKRPGGQELFLLKRKNYGSCWWGRYLDGRVRDHEENDFAEDHFKSIKFAKHIPKWPYRHIVMFDASRPFLKRRIVSELGKATAVNFCHYFSIYHYCEFWVSILVQIWMK